MENNKVEFPIIIKKKNIMMTAAVFGEIFVGVNFLFIDSTKICSAIFFFVAAITAISLWDESGEKISLSEHKFQVNKRSNVLESINYEKISLLNIEKGEDAKHKKKDFLAITFLEHNKKKKKSEGSKEKYLIDLTYYSIKDMKTIKEIITGKNSNVRVTKEFNDYINQNAKK